MLTIRAMSDGKGYASRHLEHSDYYAEGERVVGQWLGRGAELAGLSGAVDASDFDALRQGLDPRTGEFLRQRRGADRVGAGGETLCQARSLYDFTISAPKSVSILAILGGDSRLVQAHQTAVAVALDELESYAAARVRHLSEYAMSPVSVPRRLRSGVLRPDEPPGAGARPFELGSRILAGPIDSHPATR